ncbi:DNA sulfur modification protein DndE [archaeon]|jgi:DNA sulfur modification protein DndE|nr:DNA sulfur modification protein DndE [archaeon]MBT4648401.1 DNA sulfur modification protein DndE [archaeon]
MESFNRIRISSDSTIKLRTLKTRTGLTPNLLCRIGLCYSLNKGPTPKGITEIDEEGQEFNRYTLTGQFDIYIIALIKQRCLIDEINPKSSFIEQFKLHLNNGIQLMYGRVRSLMDINNLLDDTK